MARRTRRRRPAVAWLPTQRIQQGEAPNSVDAAGVQGTLVIDDTGFVGYDAFPLTFDTSKDPAWFDPDVDPLVAQPTLKDYVAGNEYRLRRIVGKAFLHASGDELDDPPEFDALVDCAVGFIVCKTDDDGSPNTNFGEVNPLAAASMNDPWIWRRRWVLNPYGTSRAVDPNSNNRDIFWTAGYPNSTAGYGSAVDGPHIDQKTARVISSQERLYCVIAARSLNQAEVNETVASDLHYNVTVRLLASLRTNMGNRRNASR